MMIKGWLYTWFQKRILLRHFDAHQVNHWVISVRSELKTFVSQIPDIGGKDNQFTKYLMMPSILIPLVRLMRDDGVPTRKIGQVIFESAATGYGLIPKPVLLRMGRACFTQERMAQWRETARQTQLRRYAGDWVCTFVEGDGETFQYGLTMTECGLLKFWRAQGLEEFVPYLCLTDWALWRLQGIEVKRTQTLANGGACCDYRYIRCGEQCPLGWPPESRPEWTGRYER